MNGPVSAKFRSKFYEGPMHTRFEFDRIDTGLFVTILDATAVKPCKTCYRCCSTNHTVVDCPFLAPKAKLAAEKTAIQMQKRFFHGMEVCNNYQTGQCQHPLLSQGTRLQAIQWAHAVVQMRHLSASTTTSGHPAV